MLKLHPTILKEDGKRIFAVLPYEEFLLIEEELRDFDDLKTLRAATATEGNAATVSIEQARKELRIPARRL